MRKIFITFLLALSASATIYADPLTEQQAKLIAQQFANTHGNQAYSAKGYKKSQVAPQPLSLAYTAPANRLYVYNRPQQQGYIIVSGDDNAAPIIGYSDQGSFDYANIPANMKDWLSMYEAQIAYAAKSGNKYRASTTTNDKPIIEPMVKTTWGQEDPYNRLCPKDRNGMRSLTGCGATAIAQVLSYHRYPDAATGMAYNNTVDLTGDTFDWSNIVDKYTNADESLAETTEEQKNAVALLMRDAGYSLDMNYGAYDSMAKSHMLTYALAQNLKIDPAVHLETKGCYDDQTWENMVYDNLATYGPLVYNGDGKGGGHCFVCDGYAGNGYFHMNWGWHGNHNGNFLLSLLNPTSGYDFSLSQDAVFGIQKPKADSKYYNRVIIHQDEIHLMNGCISNDISYLINKPTLLTLGFRAKDINTGKITYVATNQLNLKKPERMEYGKEFPFISKMDDGEYLVAPYYRADQEEWQPVQFYAGIQNEYRLSVKDGELWLYKDVPFEYTDKETLGIKLECVPSNYTLKAICSLQTNGGAHTLDYYAEIIDEQTNEVVGKGEHLVKHLGLNDASTSINYTIKTSTLDLNHTYTIVTYDGDNVISKLSGVKAIGTPTIEVVEPLSSPNIINGKIWEDEFRLHLSAILRNPNRCSVIQIHTDMCEQGQEFGIGGQVFKDKGYTIDDDLIKIEAEFNIPTTMDAGENYKLLLQPQTEGDFPFVLKDGEPYIIEFEAVSDDPTSIRQLDTNLRDASYAECYTIEGKWIGKYKDLADYKQLPSGIYIIKATYSSGKTKLFKIKK